MNLLKKNIFFISILLIILGLMLYGHTFSYPFIMDDFQQIVNNPFVHDIGHILQHFTGSSVYDANSGLGGIYYKPLMQIFYSICWQIGNGSSTIFRYLQLFLHISNSILLFYLISIVFKIHKNDELRENAKLLICFFCSLIFLIHPINAEAVLFIADLQEPLYTFWGLLLLIKITKQRIDKVDYILIYTLSLFSILSKETGILYILASSAYVIIFDTKQKRKVFAIFFITFFTYFILRFAIADLAISKPSDLIISNISLIDRLVTVPKVLSHYLILYFYPKNISLTQDWYVASLNFENFYAPACLVLLTLIIITYFSIKYKNKPFIFFSIIFLLGWGLHSQIFPLDGTVSDRWFYFSISGFTFIFLYISMKFFEKSIYQYVFFLTIACSLFTYRTYLRTLDWESSGSLFRADIKLNPSSFYLNNNIGMELLTQQKYNDAIPYFQTAIKNSIKDSDSWATAMTNLAAVYYLQQRYTETIEIAQKAMHVKNVKTLRIICASYLDLNQIESAKKCIENSLKEYPQDTALNKIMNTLQSLPKVNQ